MEVPEVMPINRREAIAYLGYHEYCYECKHDQGNYYVASCKQVVEFKQSLVELEKLFSFARLTGHFWITANLHLIILLHANLL